MRRVTQDVAMGSRNSIDYAFKNISSSACTLKGYPRYDLLSKAGTLGPHSVRSAWVFFRRRNIAQASSRVNFFFEETGKHRMRNRKE